MATLPPLENVGSKFLYSKSGLTIAQIDLCRNSAGGFKVFIKTDYPQNLLPTLEAMGWTDKRESVSTQVASGSMLDA